MAALRPATGERIWYTTHTKPTNCSDPEADWCSSGLFGAATVIPGAVFVGARNGTLRAYSTGDGEILWEYHTIQEYETVNGVRAKGGSISGHGPAIVGGMLFMGSGYSVGSGASVTAGERHHRIWGRVERLAVGSDWEVGRDRMDGEPREERTPWN